MDNTYLLTAGIVTTAALVSAAASIRAARRRKADPQPAVPPPSAWGEPPDQPDEMIPEEEPTPQSSTAMVESPPRKLRKRREEHVDSAQLFLDVSDALQQVPPMPRVVMTLLAELQSDAASADSVAEVVATDAVMAGAVLRVVNSAAFGLVRKIVNVEEAVSYLGFSAVRRLILRLQLGHLLSRDTDRFCGYNPDDLWLHSLVVGQLAEHLARRVPGADPQLASTIGLMHDIGKLAINSYFPQRVELLLAGKDVLPGESFLGRERRLFGADHAVIGGFLAARWELPEPLVTAIRTHHDVEAAGPVPEDVRRSMLVVNVANQLAKMVYVYCEDMEIDIIPPERMAELGLPADCEELLDEATLRVVDRATALSGSPGKANSKLQAV